MRHSWRVLPSASGYSALIDGQNAGRLMAGDLETAIIEIKQIIKQSEKVKK